MPLFYAHGPSDRRSWMVGRRGSPGSHRAARSLTGRRPLDCPGVVDDQTLHDRLVVDAGAGDLDHRVEVLLRVLRRGAGRSLADAGLPGVDEAPVVRQSAVVRAGVSLR